MYKKKLKNNKIRFVTRQRLVIKPIQRKIITASIVSLFIAGFTFLFWNFGMQKHALAAAVNYTWNGSSDSLWNNSTNWTPAGIPGSIDNATIGTVATKNPYLNSNQTVNNLTLNTGGNLNLNSNLLTIGGLFTMNAGATLDIKNDTLVINGNTVINGGSIINSGSQGLILAQGPSTIFGNSTGGPTLSAEISVNSQTITSRNATFNVRTTLTKTGTSSDASYGNNTFNNITTISNSSSGYFLFSNVLRDIFNGEVTFTSTGTGIIYVAHNGTATQFNQNITVNSTSTGGVRIGASTGSSILAASKIITTGNQGFSSGMLMLSNFTSAGTTNQILNLTGTAILTLGPASTFTGDIITSSSGLCLSGATFNGLANLTKNGASNDAGTGNNTFNGTTSIVNSGSGYLLMSNSTRDIYNSEVTFTSSGSGIIYPAYNGTGTQFNQNIFVNSTATGGVRIGASNGSSTLASGKTVIIGSSGFSGGMLMLGRFTSAGTTNQTINLTGTAVLGLGPLSVFNGTFTAVCGGISLNGATFNSLTSLTKNGGTNDAGTGGNIFNDVVSITNNGTGYFLTANTTRDIFNADATFTSTSSGIIYLAHNGTGTEFNQNIIVNSTGTGGIRIGASNGTSTLALNKTVVPGSIGFTSGTLMLANLTSPGATNHSITLSGNSILSLGPGSTFTGNLTAVSGGICLNGTTFNGTTILTKTGTSNDAGTGNNVFNGGTTITNSGSGYLLSANSTRDIFNSDVIFNSTGTGIIYLAHNGIGTEFNQNITVNSTSTGGIRIGASGGTSTLASSKIIATGSLGFSGGILMLANFTTAGSSPLSFLFTGSGILSLGPASTFTGDVTATCGGICLNGATFDGLANFTKTGSSNDAGAGNNVFNGQTSLTNNGSGYLLFGNTVRDIFNGEITFTSTSSGLIYPAYASSGTLFNSKIIVNSTGSGGISFGSSTGTSILANGKTITTGGLGFSSGDLSLKRFTQTGNTAQSLIISSGSASLYLSTGTTFNGEVNFAFPQIYLNGSTFNQNAVIEKKGATNNVSSGGNVFNGETTIKNSGTGAFYLANTTADDYNENVNFIQTGPGVLFPAYNTNNTFAGDISTAGSNAILTFSFAAGGMVTLNGPARQNINGNSTFAPVIKKLTVNNSNNGVLFNVPVTISTSLILTSGNVSTSAGTMMIIGNGVGVTGGNDNSYIEGPVRKIGNTAFTFPTGKNGYLRPISISAPLLATDHFTAEYFDTDPNPTYNVTSKDASLNRLTRCEYWTLNRTNGSSAVTVSLSWNSTNCIFASPADLRVSNWDQGLLKWHDLGNTSFTGNSVTGTLTAATTTNLFGAFTLGSSTAIALPIELISFTAEKDERSALLKWQTASEINNDFFSIERSSDGINFENRGTVSGSGNSSKEKSYDFRDGNPPSGTVYYRLKQTDFNGKYEYFKPVSLNWDEEKKGFKISSVGPNPFESNIHIKLENSAAGDATVILINTSGSIVYTENIQLNDGQQNVEINFMKDIIPGIYFLKISKEGDQTELVKMIKR